MAWSGRMRSRANSHPQCPYQNPSTTGEWTSSGVSEWAWCSRWWTTHHSGPFWRAVHPAAARRNRTQRDVLYEWWASPRWYPTVTPSPLTRVITTRRTRAGRVTGTTASPTRDRWTRIRGARDSPTRVARYHGGGTGTAAAGAAGRACMVVGALVGGRRGGGGPTYGTGGVPPGQPQPAAA